jgi:peptide-methionine (S)-S-oxide reductase
MNSSRNKMEFRGFIQCDQHLKNMKRLRILILATLVFSINLFGTGGMKERYELATFGGGCFWCTEAIFERVKGVYEVVSGYSGGEVANPDYKMVTSGTTGHAEVIQIRFDPGQVSYLELLEIFFRTHDPTTLNRQGADVGTQYRSIVLYHTEEQLRMTEKVIGELEAEGIWSDPIVTELKAFERFYPAEDYHQEYFENNPNQGYCRLVINPKVEKFEKVFKEMLK